MSSEEPGTSADALAAARERVTLGPVPPWAVVDAVDFNFKGKPDQALTHLYVGCQVNAAAHETFFRTVIRLETMEAVQRQSQWRLPFEPRNQSVALHWIKIRRDGREFEHASLPALRLLEREHGLESFIIDGSVTMLLVLGDVRPGDVLEACYTVASRPRLLPGHCLSFFTLPPGAPIGKFRFTARFNESRAMKWKSSVASLAPRKTVAAGEAVWDWSGENFSGPRLEPHTPDWHLPGPWIQVSDCPDWATVAAAVADAWPDAGEDPAVAELADHIAAGEPDKLLQVRKVLDLIQNEFRYLSVNLDLGGHVPTAPGPVARRRFGDCKDLSFLTLHLLRRLGVPARAILVNTKLRQSLATLLPAPSLFNHVVVEYELAGQTRWVDTTIKYQGGDALHRSIPDYGVGLPVDKSAAELIGPPRESVHEGVYELRESILLDTSGAPSLLSAIVTAKGYYADMLRAQFETQGVEKFTRERLQSYVHRFPSATRAGELAHRDDRAANEFVVAEVFEISGFIQADPYPGLCQLAYPGTLILQALPIPEEGKRQAPFALPHPCNLVHQIEVQMPAMPVLNAPRVRVESRFLRFNRVHKSFAGYWSATLSLATFEAAVPPSHLESHREDAESIWQESICHLRLPIGQPRIPRRRDFGALPAPARKPAPPKSQISNLKSQIPGPAVSAPQSETHATILPESQISNLKSEIPVPARRSRQKKKSRAILWITLVLIIFLALIAAATYLLTRH